MDDMGVVKDEFSDSYDKKNQKNAVFRWPVYLLNGAIFCGWFIGVSGLSVAWLVLLLASIGVIWSSKMVDLIEHAKYEEIIKVRRRKALAKDETAEWLNILFNRWWVLNSKNIFQLVREQLEPLINDAKPSFVEKVELKEFSFGDQTPCIEAVKTYDVVEGKRKPCSGQSPVLSRKKYQVALDVDLFLNSEEFRLVLGTRLFGKGMGVDLDIAVEKFFFFGKLEFLLTIDMECPFPHISDLTVMFVEKPEVWFNIRVLKAVQIMEVPVLKTWIHSVFMDAIETAIVDPEKMHIILSGNNIEPGINEGVSSAQGVLTVSVNASQLSQSGGNTWIVLKIGNQHFKSSSFTTDSKETQSFLVENLKTDKLVIKLKSKRIISTVKLAEYEMVLNEYNLEKAKNVETVLQKKSPKGSHIPNITIKLDYTRLPSASDAMVHFRSLPNSIVSGVVTVCIHSAEGLIFSDSSNCNSYCMLFTNRRKILTTPCAYNTTSPHWDSKCQVLVNDYTQTSFSFVVSSSWSSKKISNDEMLGVAVFNFAEGETVVQNRQLSLSGSSFPLPVVTVSITFQPVDVMNESSGAYTAPYSSGSDNESRSDTSSSKSKKS